MGIGAKKTAMKQWPSLLAILVGLMIQVTIVAYGYGVLKGDVKAIMNDVAEIKMGVASKEWAIAIEGRVNRIDSRVNSLEHKEF